MNLQQSDIASDSIHYIEAEFEFSPDWDGYEKTVIFEQGDKSYPVILVDDKISKDIGLNLGQGVWKIKAYGNDSEGVTRISTVPTKIYVHDSGLASGIPDVPLSYGEQILAKASHAEEVANGVRADADAGKFGGSGEGGNVNLTDYYNKAAIDEFLDGKQVKGDYALKSELPTKTSDLTNDSNYLTNHQSLVDYAKKSEIPDKTSDLNNDSGFLTSHQDITIKADKSYVDTQLATKQDSGNYLKTTDISNWAKASSKPPYTAGEVGALPDTTIIPSKVSDLTNDKGFLTEHQSLTNYATKSEIKPLSGKTVVCFGDSLFGMYRGETSAPAYLEEVTGATTYNVGFGGCWMSIHPEAPYAPFSMCNLADAVTNNSFGSQDNALSLGVPSYFADQLNILKSINFGNVDYAVIHYGANDWFPNYPAELDNPNERKDKHTMCGSLRYTIETLQGKFPKLQIFISTPCYRTWTTDGTVTTSDNKINAKGIHLYEVGNGYAKVAEEYNLPVIDSYHGLNVNKNNWTTYLEDGTHHNQVGRKRFGEFIGKCLASGADACKTNTVTPESIGALPITGGTVDGNISAKYIEGTWLKTNAVTTNNNLNDVAMIDSSGWVYKMSKSQLIQDIIAEIPNAEGGSY